MGGEKCRVRPPGLEMAIIVAVSAGGVVFLLVFLRALLQEPKARRPYRALLLEPLLWSETESDPEAAAGEWVQEDYD